MAKQRSLWPLQSARPGPSQAHGSSCGLRGAACFSGPERRKMGKAWRCDRQTKGSVEETRCRDVYFPFFTSPPRTDVTAPYRPYRPVMPYTSDFVVLPPPRQRSGWLWTGGLLRGRGPDRAPVSLTGCRSVFKLSRLQNTSI